MSVLTLDATYPTQRNRLTAVFRIIVAIPHLIVSQFWGYLVEALAVVQWFIVVFTGKRNKGIYEMQRSWLDYYGRVITYVALIHDVFPPFGADPSGTVPVRTELAEEEEANRLTVGLRFLWIIPAAIMMMFVGIAAAVVGLISWFSILFTGKQSQGMWDFVYKAIRFALRVQSYGLLLTDTYPSYS